MDPTRARFAVDSWYHANEWDIRNSAVRLYRIV